MRIEKVSVSEKASLLFEMDRQAFCRDFDYPARTVSDTVSYLKDCEVYLAYENEEAVGTFSYFEKDGTVEVKQLLVLPAFQGRGYGAEMMKELLKLLKGKKVWLVTHPRNTPAIITYLKSGFTITAWKDNYYGDGEPRLLFSLN